ncbi:peptidoglycan -binding protein [Defluviimonas sp. WL0050]|uniref:Peptidoglycan -binding protein n=1 Tax=Albidovulum litorale TaxID=2984134 RepID=A0ABT2ZU40_9RHOB|nr:peptidoglycan -binding protein [Defluviimonas sp. WL0050]MCV2874261.1 peptidoglycan -binding protein [Defluviimonas sp. WL0050]
MALTNGRGGQRFSANIWPGFVDAMTALLMVLMFVLTIFMIVQFTLRETIDNQDDELADLAQQVAGLADALGLERDRSTALEGEVAGLTADLDTSRAEADRQSALIATLTRQVEERDSQLSEASARITSFEAQVATLLSERDTARGEAEVLTAERDALSSERDTLVSERDALNLAIAKARSEIDAQAEAARLAAARREALDALVADLKAQGEEAAEKLSDAEAARLTEAAAAAALREKLQGAEDELTAMTLALEQQRRRAEETLTLLAAANARAGEELSEAERQKVLLDTANEELAKEKAASAEAARKVALLNEQIVALRGQLGALQDLMDASDARDAEAKVQIEALGTRLNSALAQVAAEQKRRAELEEAERIRLEAEAAALKEETKELAQYRSEFFARLSKVLEGREGVRVVGDRFVFSSEVLFEPASADLAPEGRSQIAGVVATLQDVAAEIPPEVDWIIRVDGHTDNVPLAGTGRYSDNWELSQGRALSVVRFMQDELGFPPNRLAATGFGEYHPVAVGDSPEALAQNRRIELKLTER